MDAIDRTILTQWAPDGRWTSKERDSVSVSNTPSSKHCSVVLSTLPVLLNRDTVDPLQNKLLLCLQCYLQGSHGMFTCRRSERPQSNSPVVLKRTVADTSTTASQVRDPARDIAIISWSVSISVGMQCSTYHYKYNLNI